MCREGRRKRREQHFEHLAAIASRLLTCAYNLIDVSKKDILPATNEEKYLIQGRGEDGDRWTKAITRQELSSAIRTNLHELGGYGNWQFNDWLVSHLKAEWPELEYEMFHDLVDDKPYEVIDTLRILAARKIFKGTCPVCKGW
jgi:hypothetical protein